MVSDNIQPFVEKTKAEYAKWSQLNLSLWDRIQAVKMLIVSRFAYVLETLLLIV